MKVLRQPLKKNCRLNVMKLPLITLIVFLSIEVFSQCKPEAFGSLCASSPISFKANASGYTNTSVLWEFGDGTPQSTTNQVDPKFSYGSSGTYTVTFTGVGTFGTCKETFDVFVKPSPVVKVQQIRPRDQCFKGNHFIFVDSSEAVVGSNLVRRTVIADEGFFHESITPKQADSIDFITIDPRGGTYNVWFEVEDQNGCVIKKQYHNIVTVRPRIYPQIIVDNDKSTFLCDSIHLTLKNNSLYGHSAIRKFSWDWGDGEVIEGTKDSNITAWSGLNGDNILNKSYSKTGSYTIKVVVENNLACKDSLVLKTVNTKHSIVGDIYHDKNKNCVQDSNEELVEQELIGLFKFNNKFSQIKDGQYYVTLDNGIDYKASFNPFTSTNPLIDICGDGLNIKLDSNSTCSNKGPDLGIKYKKCALMTVKVLEGRFRRCVNGNVDLELHNWGIKTAKNVLVTVKYPDFIATDVFSYSGNSPIKLVESSNKELVFEIDSFSGLSTERITISRKILCLSSSRNRVGCVVASVSAKDECQIIDESMTTRITIDDSSNMQLVLKKTEGNSSDYSFRLYANNATILRDNLDLTEGDSVIYTFKQQKNTRYNISVDQLWKPSLEFEITTDNANNILGTSDTVFIWKPEIGRESTFCGRVLDSYDPNDKQVFPTELDIKKDIPFAPLLTYTIRFQNTGNDTAYKVVVEDVLSDHFDFNTFDPIQSTHDFHFKVEPQDGGLHKVLFIFDDINLVDSLTNEAGSQGSITFKIAIKQNISKFTKSVKNKASIFFDFNPPIITNFAEVKIVDQIKDFDPLDVWKNGDLIQKVFTIDSIVCDTFYSPLDNGNYYTPNINRTGIYVELDTSEHDYTKYYKLDLKLPYIRLSVEQDGAKIDAKRSVANHYAWLNCDSGYSIIPNEIADTFRATNNGRYAVEISSLTCYDTSICFDVTSIIEDSIPDDSLINIYDVELNTYSVYPNPNNGTFQIVMQNDPSSNLRFDHISLFDVNGKEIPIARNEETITVGEDVKAGMYFLKMIDYKRVYSKRISIIK